MCSGIERRRCSEDTLQKLYDNIMANEIVTGWETDIVTFFNPSCEAGYLEGIQWCQDVDDVLLNEHCLYYFCRSRRNQMEKKIVDVLYR